MITLKGRPSATKRSFASFSRLSMWRRLSSPVSGSVSAIRSIRCSAFTEASRKYQVTSASARNGIAMFE